MSLSALLPNIWVSYSTFPTMVPEMKRPCGRRFHVGFRRSTRNRSLKYRVCLLLLLRGAPRFPSLT